MSDSDTVKLLRECNSGIQMAVFSIDEILEKVTDKNLYEILKKINENESAARQKRGNIMIHPSYVELMKVINNNVEFGEEPVVNSRYSLVIAAAKRARQIIAGDEPMADKITCPKPLSIAVEELYEGKVKIIPDTEDEE